MTDFQLTYGQLETKLSEARDIIAAIKDGEADALLSQKRIMVLRLKEAEAILLENEKRYRTLFSTMTEGFALHEIICDDEGRPVDYRFVEVNQAFGKLTGLDPHEVVGKTVKEVLPDTDPYWIEQLGAVALTGASRNLENYCGAIGKYFQVYAYSPAPRQFAVVFMDITERKHDEEAIAASEKKYRELIETANSVIVRWNKQGIIHFINEQGAELLGYKADELIGQNANILVPKVESTGRDLSELVRDIIEHPEQYIYNPNENIKKDGSRCWIAWANRAIRDENGDVREMLAVGNDITALKEAEQALRQSQNDLNRAQEVGKIGSWRMDVRKNELTWSAQNHHIFGVPPGTPLTYETFLDKVHPDDREGVDAEWRAALKERGEPYTTDHRIIVDGEIKWVREKAYLEFDDSGDLRGGFGITQDITERNAAEEQIKNIAKFPAENPFPVLRVYANGTVTYSNIPGRALLEKWKTDIGRKAPPAWRKLVANSLASGRSLAKKVTCGKTIFSIVITPVVDKGYVNLYGQDITRRIKAEHDLRHINRRLEQRVRERTAELNLTIDELEKTKSYLLQAHRITSLGTWEWNITNNRLWCSDEALRLFGLGGPKGELSFHEFLEMVHPDDVDFVQQAVKSAVNDEEVYALEHRIIRRDNGQERIVRQRGEIFHDHDSCLVRLMGTIQDVTEVRRKERLLLQKDRELQERGQMLDLAYDAILIHDLEGIITYWNKGAEVNYGWEAWEVLGKITHEVLQTRFSEPFMKIIYTVSSTGRWEGELTHTTRDGRHVTVESRWVLRCDDQGNPSAIMEIERDITRRKIAEKKTIEARAYAESIIETVQEALVVLNQDLKILSANAAFYKTFRLRPVDVIGIPIYMVDAHQWNMPQLKTLLEDILPKNTSFEAFEMTFTPVRGANKDLLLNARRIFQEQRKTEMILLAIQDITDRKKQQKQILELSEELVLAEEEQRQKIATALHDSVGQMLAFSKRELSSLLKDPSQRTEDRLKTILDEISKSLRQSRELTADLSSPTLHTFGLEAAFEELLEEFSRKYGFACRFNVADAPAPLEKKVELLLYRSIQELLCNVAKHSHAKNVTLDVQKSDSFLEFILSDDGRGFDASRIKNKNSKKKSFGLFSIQQRLMNIGGSFKIESEKRKGAKIILQAPLKSGKN